MLRTAIKWISSYVSASDRPISQAHLMSTQLDGKVYCLKFFVLCVYVLSRERKPLYGNHMVSEVKKWHRMIPMAWMLEIWTSSLLLSDV